MIQFKKEDIESKSTDELLKYFHESRFHHQDYISILIEVLYERGLTRTILFEKKSTQGLVNAICFDSDKHKNNYLQLAKEELVARDYDVSSIPDIHNPDTFSSVINGKEKEIPSKKNDFESEKTSFESKINPNFPRKDNSSRSENNSTQSSSSNSFKNQNKSNNNKFVGLAGAALIVVIIKLGLMYAHNEGEKADLKQDQRIHEVFYGKEGLLNTKIQYYKNYLDSVKTTSPSFLLTLEAKNKIIDYEINKINSIEFNTTETEQFKSDFVDVYREELDNLLESYR
jgi:hypothetical protein